MSGPTGSGEPAQEAENTCPDCAGTGRVDGSDCTACGGSGAVVEPVGDA